MQLVVLAGGFGTRLRGAIADGIPKPMAPISGRPFLSHLFDGAIRQGVSSFHLLVGYAADVIVDHYGKSYRSIPITYSREESPLGTGGALKSAAAHLSEQFVLTSGDTFADVPYRQLLELLDSGPLALALAEVEDAQRYGSVAVEGDVVVGFREKGTTGSGLINAGVYACDISLLTMMPADSPFSFEVDFLEPSLPRIRPRYLKVDSDIIDIGTPESYARANSVFDV